jgi:flagellar hook-associated protein 2
MSSLSALSGVTSGVTSGSSSSSPFTVSGLISGLNTSAIIQGLMAVEQQKITNLDQQKQTVTARQAAFDGIEAKVLALQGTLTPLTSSQNSVFAARTATSSDTSIVTAAASSSAVNGVYNLHVVSTATASQVASQGFDNLSSAISQGTLQLKIGAVTSTITIDSTNNTLQGLADAINASGAAATAYIVNDGSGTGQQGYRLVLASKATGTSNQINITSNLAPSGGGAIKPIFDSGTISNAIAGSGFSGTSTIGSNAGAAYTGTSNNVYTFKVVQGGTVGTDNNIQLSYSESTGANTGTLTLNQGDVNALKTVAQGIQVQFGAGTLVTGDSFSVKAFVPTVQAATDASITVGSNAGALTVTSASNQISTLIPGVTLSLKRGDPNTEVTVTVGGDTAAMQKSIDSFVSAYNDTISTIAQQTSYDPSTGVAGPLLSDYQTQQLEQQLRSVVDNLVPGANPLMNNLGALGITTDSTGKLVVDDTKVSDVLSGNVAGVSAEDVRGLFALTGSSPNPGVQFITGSSRTLSSATPYTLQIAQAAEQASLTAPNALAASTVIDNSNNTFTIGLDGKTSQPLTLPSGTYTRTALAQAVTAAINGASSLAGAGINVGVTNNNLVLTSNRYGSTSLITMQSGTALAALGFLGGESAQGRDVAGNFLVGGAVEPALGQGQFLTGNQGNTNTAALEVRVTLTPADVGTGMQTSVSVSNGLAAQLNNVLANLSDPVTGRFHQVDGDYQAALTQIANQETQQKAYIQAKTAQLQAQFAAMEQTLNKLQAASSAITALAQSLTSLSASNSNNANSNRSSGA